MSRASLQTIYAQIPTFSCKAGCHDCCGPVPFSPSEAAFAGVQSKPALAELRAALKTGCEDCPHVTPQGCGIYEFRPFMCRIFGATDQGSLACPHGCKPETPLTEARVNELTDEYLRIVEVEEIQELREHRKAVRA